MKFKIVKHFSLDFLGEDWKDCYLDLKPLTIADVKERLPKIAKLQEDNPNVSEGVDLLVEVLTDKFIGGKVVTESGTVVDLPKENISDLPIEVIGKAFSFLSSSGTFSSTKP